MNQIINVGIAGFGMSGQIFQAPFLDTDKRFCIKKVYERKTSISKEQYPYVEVVRTFEELFTEEIDLIIIATPNRLHYSMAKQALLAGKNVIVEKPLANTSKEADDLIKVAKEKNVLLSVYQNRRWDGGFRTAKKIIEEGKLGRVVDYEVHFDRYNPEINSKQWKETGELGVGFLYDLGVHIIDQAVDLFGMPKEVYADIRTQREHSKIDDNFQVYLYYEDKKVVLSSSQLVKENVAHIVVHGTKGSFIKYGRDQQEDKLKAGVLPNSKDFGLEEEEFWGILNTTIDGTEFREKVKTELGDYHYYFDNIYQVLTADEELIVKPEQARDVLRIIETAMESNKKGCRLKINRI